MKGSGGIYGCIAINGIVIPVKDSVHKTDNIGMNIVVINIKTAKIVVA